MGAEMWLPVSGFPGYEVSDHGRVRSLDRVVPHPTGGKLTLRGRVFSPKRRSGSHLSVTLRRNGKGYDRQVHRLVARAFIGPIPDGAHVLHWNDDPADNRVSNLRFGNDSDNAFDKVRNGRHHLAVRTHCPWGHEYKPGNLCPSVLRTNGRSCLACSRARAHIQRHPELKQHHQTISDRYYVAITRKETTRHV